LIYSSEKRGNEFQPLVSIYRNLLKLLQINDKEKEMYRKLSANEFDKSKKLIYLAARIHTA